MEVLKVQLKEIKVGTKLEISLIDSSGENISPYYPIKLQHINKNDMLEVDLPSVGTQMIFFENGTTTQITITYKDGLYSFRAKVIERFKKKDIPIMVLKQESEIIKIQRRSYFRLNCNCVIRYRPYKLPAFGVNDESFRTTQTVDLSGGGMCIIVEEKIEQINFLECVIILEKDIIIKAIGKIISMKKDETADSNRWKAGIHFQRINEFERERIINFVFQEQLKLRRKGLV